MVGKAVQRGMDKNRKEELDEIKGKAKETVTVKFLSHCPNNISHMQILSYTASPQNISLVSSVLKILSHVLLEVVIVILLIVLLI